MIVLETERLLLRTWEDSDLDVMAAIDQDPKVCQYLPAIGARTGTEANIQRIKKCYEEYGFCLYAVELKSSHELIGFCGLSIPNFEAHFTPAVEIGWRLSSRHWGKGYATEAARAVLRYAFLELNLKEVVSFTVINNKASRRVMEKIGMHHDFSDDFDHPRLSDDSPLKKHVLYRISKENFSYRDARHAQR